MKPQFDRGFLILAFDDDQSRYVDCAKRLAHSIRHWCPGFPICLLTDIDLDDAVFDRVQTVQRVDTANPFANDWLSFYKTPFRETIKLEADMIVTADISHWWTMLRHRDVVISQGCVDWQAQPCRSRAYRKIFDENDLPDVYNAITYWRLSSTAKTFFDFVRDIFANWSELRGLLKCSEDIPSTDVVYAMAAKIMGVDRVTLPRDVSYPQITHMKKHHAMLQGEDWTQEMIWEQNPFRINTLAHRGILHYVIKDWQP